MARAKKFVLASGIHKKEKKLIAYAKRVPIILFLSLIFCAAATVLSTYQGVEDGVISIGLGCILVLISIVFQLFLILSPYFVHQENTLDVTRSLFMPPALAVLMASSFVFILDYPVIMMDFIHGQLNIFVWSVVCLLQFVLFFPVALCLASTLKYGSKFRFFSGVVLKVLYSQWECKEWVVKRCLDALRWIYGKLGRYPFLKAGITVSVKLRSEVDGVEQHVSNFSFPKSVYTSIEDVAEGCFIAKKYLTLTGQLNEQAQRPWSKGAVEFLNSMISNPRFYSELPVHYSTYKRTGRMLAEYGEKLFRTEDDVFFEEQC